MPAPRAFSAFMFWIMTAAGAAVLVPCLVLPPWIEYRAASGQRRARLAHLATLQHRVASLQRQIDHLRNDPAYLERLAREELAIETPGVTVVDHDAPAMELPDAAALDDSTDSTLDSDALSAAFPRLAAAADAAVDSLPRWVAVFAAAETRPWVMGLSCALVASAVLLLGSPRRRRTAARAGAADVPALTERPCNPN